MGNLAKCTWFHGWDAQHTACAKATRCPPGDAQILGIDPAVTCIILQAKAMARGIALAVEVTTTEGGELRRVVGAAVIGNALEWYDFVIYSFLATTIASIFFPDSDEVAALPRILRRVGRNDSRHEQRVMRDDVVGYQREDQTRRTPEYPSVNRRSGESI